MCKPQAQLHFCDFTVNRAVLFTVELGIGQRGFVN
jgi:hypothetical protein